MPRPVDRGEDALLGALFALLPRGEVWQKVRGSDLGKVTLGTVSSLARLRQRAGALLEDAFPATAYELLTEWERTLGLPDPCAGTDPPLQRRRAQVVARLAGRGGQSVPYIVARAADLGYTISVREYAPSRLGHMRMGDRMQDAEWAHVWAIQAPATTVFVFRMGQSGFGERFRSWGNEVLECEMASVKPAHTILLFQYS